MAQQQRHPIFDDIQRGDLEAVQQRVQADAAVLEEREEYFARRTPLQYAIDNDKPAIALWLLEHRGQHDVDAASHEGLTALHHASFFGSLELVQRLVAAGANPAALTVRGITPLMLANGKGETDIVAFLLQLPSVKAGIDHLDEVRRTALSRASYSGHQPIVQLLLDAGADPTIPAGYYSPLNLAIRENHHAIADLLRHATAEPERVRACMAAMGKDEVLGENPSWEISTYLLPAWATK